MLGGRLIQPLVNAVKKVAEIKISVASAKEILCKVMGNLKRKNAFSYTIKLLWKENRLFSRPLLVADKKIWTLVRVQLIS
jgi:hypothetical protein